MSDRTAAATDRATRIDELREQTALTADERQELAELLVEAADEAGSDGAIETERDHIATLQELSDDGADSDLRPAVARALANATDWAGRGEQFRERCSAERVRADVRRLETLHETYGDVAEQYGRGLSHAVAMEGDEGDLNAAAEALSRLEALYDGSSAVIARHVAAGHVADARNHVVSRLDEDGGLAGREHDALDRIEELYEAHETDGVAAELSWIVALSSITYRMDDDWEAQERQIDRLRSLYGRHPVDEIAEAFITAVAAIAEDADEHERIDAMERYSEEAKRRYEDHPTDDVASRLAELHKERVRSYCGVDRLDPAASVCDRLDTLHETHSDAVATPYSWALLSLVHAQVDDGRIQRAEKTLSTFESLYEAHPDVDRVTTNFSRALIDELYEQYVETDQYELARQKFEHPAATERLETRRPSDVTWPEYDGDERFAIQTLAEKLPSMDDVDVDDRAPNGVRSVSATVILLLCTGPLLGAFVAFDQSLGLIESLGPYVPSGFWWWVLLIGVSVVVGGLFSAAKVAPSKSVAFPMFVAIGPLEFVVRPATPREGVTSSVLEGALIGVIACALLWVPLWGGYLVVGLLIWVLVAVGLIGASAFLLKLDAVSPAVSTLVPPQTVESLDVTPIEAERLTRELTRL
ncbi:hypothetical protein [Halopiger goleimassiliensis]|uniref:hypothetical protein n=1 Tax=Halopiger goleimassiliensis TaxID=1293048 RepID=UPI000677877A|nr:hypothetical protein [Halopiger goleimassiliensis]